MSKKLILLAVVLGLLVSGKSPAQDLPETQIWMLDLEEGIPMNARQISGGRGYRNQPWFSPDGKALYFTSEQDDGQTDIVRHDLASGEQVLIQPSPESEYSPLPIPGQNALSVVRVELPDGQQRLWKLPLNGGNPEVLLPDIEPVGYHAWLDADTVALFILGETFDLHIAKLSTGKSRRVAVNIGRTLRRHPDTGHLLFVDKNVEPWTITGWNPVSGGLTTVMALFPGVEDFEVDDDGRFWMGFGSKLYRSKSDHPGWRLEADLREWGIAEITRLAVCKSEPRMILVGL